MIMGLIIIRIICLNFTNRILAVVEPLCGSSIVGTPPVFIGINVVRVSNGGTAPR